MAKKHNKLTEADLAKLITSEVGAITTEDNSVLSAHRSEAARAYTGLTTQGLQATTGMSSIIVNVMQPATDTLVTYMTKLLCSDHDTVVFAPKDKSLAEKARGVTDTINDIIHKDNNGYEIINRWVKDAAISGTGIVKVYWDNTPTTHKETYTGTKEEFKVWQSNKKEYTIDILSEETMVDTLEVTHESTDDTLELKETTTTYTLKLSKEVGIPRIMNIPPEEFLINDSSRGINDNLTTRFVAHRQMMYATDVLAMFPDIEVEDLQKSSGQDNTESIARGAFNGTSSTSNDSDGPTDGLKQVEVVESWVKADMDGDGVSEWTHAFTSGDYVIMHEEWVGPIPMCSFTFFPVPYQFRGQSVWHKLKDYHKIKTALIRSDIDTAVQKNTLQIFARKKDMITRDIRSGRPGIIDVKASFKPSDVMLVPKAQGAIGETLAILQYLDKEIVAQIGIDPVTGMVSTDIEKSGNDSEKTSMTLDNSSTKIEMYGREMAEIGLRDMVWAITDMAIQHGILTDIGLSRMDIRAKVGLGHQTTKQKLQGAQAIMMRQEQLEMSGTNPVPIPAKMKLAASTALVDALGYEEGDAGLFFPDVDAVEEERARLAKAAEQAQAQQMQMQQIQVQQQSALDETTMLLNQAKAQEAKVKAESAARNQELAEERAVTDIENVNKDNELNVRRQEAVEEQMIGKLDLDEQKLALEVAKADDESERPDDVTHK